MAELFGAQRLVLQAILDLPKDSAGFVTDSQIAQSTQIDLDMVRDWIRTLGAAKYVEFARTEAGLSALITAEGRLQLGLYQPLTPPQGTAGPGAPGPPQPPLTRTHPQSSNKVNLAVEPAEPGRRYSCSISVALVFLIFLMLVPLLTTTENAARIAGNA